MRATKEDSTSVERTTLKVDRDFLLKLAKRGDTTDKKLNALETKVETLIHELYHEEEPPPDFDIKFLPNTQNIQESGKAFQNNFRLLCKTYGIASARINFIA